MLAESDRLLQAYSLDGSTGCELLPAAIYVDQTNMTVTLYNVQITVDRPHIITLVQQKSSRRRMVIFGPSAP